jgi:UDP-glucose 4-epimerase
MNSFKESILILGGGGFIGRHVVERFVQSGAKVTVLDRFMPDDLDRSSVNWIVGSTSDQDLLKNALVGISHVIDLASSEKPGTLITSIADHISNTVGNTLRIAETCQRAGVKSYIYTSSGGTVYGETSLEVLTEDCPCKPINYYGAGKLTIEQYLRLLSRGGDFKAIVLRLANPFGERQRAVQGQGFIAAVFNALKSGEALEIWGKGDTIRDFIYVGDVADAFYHAVLYYGYESVFNIGSGMGRSLNEILAVIEDKCGQIVQKKYLETRNIDVKRSILDISRAERELKWHPKTEFGDAIFRTKLWWEL